MSVDLMLYLRRAAMPSARVWGKAIAEAGFALTMDPNIELTSDRHYLPCQYQGAPSGLVLSAAPVSEDERRSRGVSEELDYVVTFSARGDDAEFASAVIACGVLSQLANGTLFDPQSGESLEPYEALDWVHEILKQIGN